MTTEIKALKQALTELRDDQPEVSLAFEDHDLSLIAGYLYKAVNLAQEKIEAAKMAPVLYVYNQRNKKSKVHLFRAHWKWDILNPDMTGDEQQTCHQIDLQCVQNPYKWTYAKFKVRDFGKDYVVTDKFPEHLQLCGSCKKLLESGAELTYPEEQIIKSYPGSIDGDRIRVR